MQSYEVRQSACIQLYDGIYDTHGDGRSLGFQNQLLDI